LQISINFLQHLLKHQEAKLSKDSVLDRYQTIRQAIRLDSRPLEYLTGNDLQGVYNPLRNSRRLYLTAPSTAYPVGVAIALKNTSLVSKTLQNNRPKVSLWTWKPAFLEKPGFCGWMLHLSAFGLIAMHISLRVSRM
jgi:hypothetical protein